LNPQAKIHAAAKPVLNRTVQKAEPFNRLSLSRLLKAQRNRQKLLLYPKSEYDTFLIKTIKNKQHLPFRFKLFSK
jgi:hypothetical protein